jgi:hypothetical protein
MANKKARTVPNNLLDEAVAKLLLRVPDHWCEYDADRMAAYDEQALSRLVSSGLIQRRMRLRMRMDSHPVAAEAMFTFTGQAGLTVAMRDFLVFMFDHWAGLYLPMPNGEALREPLCLAEALKPHEWRLTDQAVMALSYCNGGRNSEMMAVVCNRKPLLGFGEMVGIPKLKDATTPADVRVSNCVELADAIAEATKNINAAESPEHQSQPIGKTKEPTTDGSPTGETSEDSAELSDWVTLGRIANIIPQSIATLKRYKKDGRLPSPCKPAKRNGQADYWKYEIIRPVIDQLCGTVLPQSYPDGHVLPLNSKRPPSTGT